MKELTFPRYIPLFGGGGGGAKACFSQENAPFDEELVCLKMAADRGLGQLCFLEVDVILEV